MLHNRISYVEVISSDLYKYDWAKDPCKKDINWIFPLLSLSLSSLSFSFFTRSPLQFLHIKLIRAWFFPKFLDYANRILTSGFRACRILGSGSNGGEQVKKQDSKLQEVLEGLQSSHHQQQQICNELRAELEENNKKMEGIMAWMKQEINALMRLMMEREKGSSEAGRTLSDHVRTHNFIISKYY